MYEWIVASVWVRYRVLKMPHVYKCLTIGRPSHPVKGGIRAQLRGIRRLQHYVSGTSAVPILCVSTATLVDMIVDGRGRSCIA